MRGDPPPAARVGCRLDPETREPKLGLSELANRRQALSFEHEKPRLGRVDDDSGSGRGIGDIGYRLGRHLIVDGFLSAKRARQKRQENETENTVGKSHDEPPGRSEWPRILSRVFERRSGCALASHVAPDVDGIDDEREPVEHDDGQDPLPEQRVGPDRARPAREP